MNAPKVGKEYKCLKQSATGQEYPTGMTILLKGFVKCDSEHTLIGGDRCPGRCLIEVKGRSEQEEKYLCLCSYYSYTTEKVGKFSDKVFWELEEVEPDVAVKTEPYFPRRRMLRID